MTDLLANTSLVGFYALGFVAIFASLRVIMLANPVHAILSMIVSLLALAGIFFILGAPLQEHYQSSSMQVRFWCCLCL